MIQKTIHISEQKLYSDMYSTHRTVHFCRTFLCNIFGDVLEGDVGEATLCNSLLVNALQPTRSMVHEITTRWTNLFCVVMWPLVIEIKSSVLVYINYKM